MQNWMFQVFFILICQFIVVGDSQQVYPSTLYRLNQKLSVHIYLFVVFVLFGQFLSLIKYICIGKWISKCEVGLIWLLIAWAYATEIVAKSYAKAIMKSLHASN